MNEVERLYEMQIRLEEKLDSIAKVGTDTLIQATKTNGRVNNLESRVDRIMKSTWLIAGGFGSIVGGIIVHYLTK